MTTKPDQPGISALPWTPSPWILSEKPKGTKGVWMHDDKGEFIALVTGRNQPTEEAANARLIASAPLLAEALREVYEDPEITNTSAWQIKAHDLLSTLTQ